MRKRHQYRMLQTAFVFALIGMAFFAGYQGFRYADERKADARASHSSPQKHPTPFTVEWFTEDPVAFATFILGVVTTGLAVVTGGLYFATRGLASDAVETARNEFEATHRPRLKVRYFKRLGQNAQQATVRLTVVNVGDVAGVSWGCRAVVDWLHPDNLPPLIDINMGYGSTSRTFEVGEFEEVNFTSPQLVAPIQPDDSRTWVIYGIIDYRDKNGTRVWRTAFCRAWNHHLQRFARVEDADYDYED